MLKIITTRVVIVNCFEQKIIGICYSYVEWQWINFWAVKHVEKSKVVWLTVIEHKINLKAQLSLDGINQVTSMVLELEIN